jgi:hypothetical protein
LRRSNRDAELLWGIGELLLRGLSSLLGHSLDSAPEASAA